MAKRLTKSLRLELLSRLNAGASPSDLVESHGISLSSAKRLKKEVDQGLNTAKVTPFPGLVKASPQDESTRTLARENAKMLALRIREVAGIATRPGDLTHLANANKIVVSTLEKLEETAPESETEKEPLLDEAHQQAVLEAEREQRRYLELFVNQIRKRPV